ncbi:hypothetical protein LARI1_G001968 [Lachnellula arida]|uniref:DUF6594 domain-containing protein n=1 Tax=Lachnellula arida TaxID=1316785 RepID=A0A8T9BRY2_9HELO|nr:hypothetical protein LARI1_G001968 [Lachnellula arida]
MSQRKVKLENFKQGYPRLAAFQNLDKNFSFLKRFDNLHMRVLLEKQDHLVELENKLHQCDDAETVRLNLASRRQDSNQERRQILQQIETALGSYVRSESTCFVGSLEDEDYVTLRPDEPDTAGLEALLEMSLKAFPKLFKHISSSQVRLCYPHWMFTS